jgi:hypothetical protein
MIWLNKNWSQSLYLSELFENLERPREAGFFAQPTLPMSAIGPKRTSSCGFAVRAETKRELKMQRKSPAEAGQTSRAWRQTR